MREVLDIGPVPSAEDCEQLGPNYNPVKARKECERFIRQLREQFGPEPERCRLFIQVNHHDFGTYFEVACSFYDDVGAEYAYNIEANCPEYWLDKAEQL